MEIKGNIEVESKPTNKAQLAKVLYKQTIYIIISAFYNWEIHK